MKRDDIFKNVSFGGAWSERIFGVEQRIEALEVLEAAIHDTLERDLRTDSNMLDALKLCTGRIQRGSLIEYAWMKALACPFAAERSRELKRLHLLIERGLGTSVQL